MTKEQGLLTSRVAMVSWLLFVVVTLWVGQSNSLVSSSERTAPTAVNGFGQNSVAAGERPTYFNEGDPVTLYASKLTSVKTQLPYPFYHAPYCRPNKTETVAVFPGEQLLGTVMQSTVYNMRFKKDLTCRVACKKNMAYHQLQTMRELIENEYTVNFVVDGMPCTRKWTEYNHQGKENVRKVPGFPVGAILQYTESVASTTNSSEGTPETTLATYHMPLLYNHFELTMLYSETERAASTPHGVLVGTLKKGNRDNEPSPVPSPEASPNPSPEPQPSLLPPQDYVIVGCYIEPRSVQHEDDTSVQAGSNGEVDPRACGKGEYYSSPQLVTGVNSADIYWTYSVRWERTELAWKDRWNSLLDSNSTENLSFHWFFIINSGLITSILTGMVVYILFRTLSYRFRRLDNQTEDSEMEKRYLAEEDTGWKLLHGDVFRSPSNLMLLSAMVGTGSQFLLTTVLVLLGGVFGLFTARNGGGGVILTNLLTILTICSFFNGYFSTRVYRMLKGRTWRKNCFVTAFLFSTIFMVSYLLIDIIFAVEESSASLSLLPMLTLLSLWLLLSVPLTFLGGFIASRKAMIPFPVEVNQIPRQIPPQPWYVSPWVTISVGGLIPFAVTFSEMFFLFASYWNGYYYTSYLPIFTSFLLFIVCSAELGIVLVYNQFGREDYHWWWRAYLTPASSGGYLFLYAIFYLVFRTEIRRATSIMIFLGYSFLLSAFISLMVGTFSFGMCVLFVRKIYSSIRVD